MDEAKKKDNAKAAPKRKGGGAVVLVMVALGCLVPFGVPTLVVSLGLLPTIIALVTDTDARRSSVATIGYMNLAGVLPFIVDLWQRGQTMEAALAIVRDPMSWVVMFGAAGMGQLILFIVPPIVASTVAIKQESRLKTLRQGMKELEVVWGPDVANVAPLEVVRKHNGAE